MSPDIHALTGAYAVDALPDGEREMFEEHLAECSACQQEVAELQATAARLGGAVDEGPPTGMKDAVMAAIDRTRQEPPARTSSDDVGVATVVPLRRPWYDRLVAAAAVVLLIVAGALGAVVIDLQQRIGEMESDPTSGVLTAADMVMTEAEGPGGSRARVLASASLGEGVIMVDDMAPAPSDRDYQLWLIRGTEADPAGLLEVAEDGTGRHVMTGDMAEVTAIGVTVEPAGGSAQPTTDPVMVLELPST
jgi:anti-sigma-K factor RskA